MSAWWHARWVTAQTECLTHPTSIVEPPVSVSAIRIRTLSLRERPPGHVVAANYAHERGGLFPHPLPSPEGRGGVGSLARFMGRAGIQRRIHSHHSAVLSP